MKEKEKTPDEILLLKRASSIIYLGMNCSYASKPGHLFRTAYVSMSMWFLSRACSRTRSSQGQFFERKYSRQARLTYCWAVAHVKLCTLQPFSQQYFNMSRFPLIDALPLVLQFQSNLFSSRTYRSNLRSFL